jgi:hypothetical protein
MPGTIVPGAIPDIAPTFYILAICSVGKNTYKFIFAEK